MHSNRRSFLKRAGAIGAVAALGGLKTVSAETKPTKPAGQEQKGLARGLTLVTMRRNGEYRLGAKTSEGICRRRTTRRDWLRRRWKPASASRERGTK